MTTIHAEVDQDGSFRLVSGGVCLYSGRAQALSPKACAELALHVHEGALTWDERGKSKPIPIEATAWSRK